jgi:uncharacterized membrane protein
LGALLMAFAPLLDAAPAIPIHAFAAMAAFGLGVVQLAAAKGTLPHRTLGWIWVGLMLSVAVSSFWIHQIRLVGPWSPIHLLSIFVLITVPLAVWRAHQHRVADHRRIMISVFCGALVIAGLFTLLPGRIMHAVVFGPWDSLWRAVFPGAFRRRRTGAAEPGSRRGFGIAGRHPLSLLSLWKNEGKNRSAAS